MAAIERTRFGQVGCKVEATPGTPESLLAANYEETHQDVKHDFDQAFFERATSRSTLAVLPSVPVARMLKISGTKECTGGSATVVGSMDPYLRGMGFVRAAAKMVAIGSVTNGPFIVGQVIGNNASQGSATKTGRVLALESGKIYYQVLTGTFASSDTITGYVASGSAPSASASANPVSAGHVYTPVNPTVAADTEAVTMERRFGGQLFQITGGKGTGRLTFAVREIPRLAYDFSGPMPLDGGAPEEQGYIDGVSTPTTPEGCRGMLARFDNSSPEVISKVEIDFGLTVTQRETIGTSFSDSGYVEPAITDRKVKMTFDPEYSLPGFGEDSKFFAGTVFRAEIAAGTLAGPHGMLVVVIPEAQISTLGSADKNGVANRNVEAIATKSDAGAEIVIAQVFTV